MFNHRKFIHSDYEVKYHVSHPYYLGFSETHTLLKFSGLLVTYDDRLLNYHYQMVFLQSCHPLLSHLSIVMNAIITCMHILLCCFNAII